MLQRIGGRLGTAEPRRKTRVTRVRGTPGGIPSMIPRTLPYFLAVAVIYMTFGGRSAQTQPGGFFGADVSFSVRQLPLDGIRWGGPIQSIARNPTDPNEVFAASQSGGLFKSSDAGNNWTHVDSLIPSDLNVVKFLPRSGAILVTSRDDWRSPNGGGVWRSEDGGAVWTPILSNLNGLNCDARPMGYGIAADPELDRVFVATKCGLWRSDNQGRSFPTRVTPSGVIYDVMILPSGDVVAGGEAGIYYTDTGGTFQLVTRSSDGVSLAMSGRDGNYRATFAQSTNPGLRDIYAAVNPPPPPSPPPVVPAQPSVIVVSRDGGRTWRSIVGPTDPAFRGSGGGAPFVRAFPSASGATDMYLYFGNNLSVWQTGPFPNGDISPLLGQAIWRKLALNHPDPHDIDFVPDSGTALLIATDGGMEICNQTTFSCSPAGVIGPSRGLNAMQSTVITGQRIRGASFVFPAAYHHYFGTWHDDIWYSDDDGANWAGGICCETPGIELAREVPTWLDSRIAFENCGPCGFLLSRPLFTNLLTWPSVSNASRLPAFIERRPDSVFSQMSSTVIEPAAVWVENNIRFDEPATATKTKIGVVEDCGFAGGGFGCTRLAASSEARFAGYVESGERNPALYFTVMGQQSVAGGLLAPASRLGFVSDFLTSDATGIHVAPSEIRFPEMAPYSGGTALGGAVNIGATPSIALFRDVFAVDPQAAGHLIAPDVGSTARSGAIMESWDGGDTWTVMDDLTNLVTSGARFNFRTRPAPAFFWPLVSAISFFPESAEMAILGTMNNGLFFSSDRGRTWRRIPGTEGIPSINDFHWRSANTVLVSSGGRGLWEVRITYRIPRAFLRLVCRDCELLSIAKGPAFDSAILSMGGQVNDATQGQDGMAQISLTPGSSWLWLEKSQASPPFEVREEKKPGNFSAVPQAAALVQQGFVIRGFTFSQGKVSDILFARTELEVPPAAFIRLKKLPGTRTLGLYGQPYVTLHGDEMRGSSIPSGRPMTVRGQNFTADGSLVTLTVDNNVVSKGTKVDADGTFTFTFAVSQPIGSYSLTASQPSANQQTPRIITTFNVVHEDEAEKAKKQ